MLFRRVALLHGSCKQLLARQASTSTPAASLITVSKSDNDQICRIQLNNVRQRNILSLAMINDLIKAVDENEQSSRVIILTAGDQKVFSSGHSLKELAELSKTNACASVFNRCTEMMLKYIAALHLYRALLCRSKDPSIVHSCHCRSVRFGCRGRMSARSQL